MDWVDPVAPQDGPVRFNDLARMVGGASKDDHRTSAPLERGLVRREVMDTTPVSVHYEITEFGRSALGFLDDRKWSEGLRKKFGRG